MSLEGDLSAFGLSEILQLIAVQQKSGMLSIASEERSKVLFFREGKIISTRDRRRKTKDPLRDYLTRYGILTREDLIRLMQISAQSKLDLTDIIVSEGFLSEDDMRTHYRSHIQEEVHEILTWDQCSYKFIPGQDIIAGIKLWGDFSIEGMLMESMRRIDEFPQALKLLPDLGTRIIRVDDVTDEPELTANEARILQLLTEERTLGRLIGQAQITKYETYETLRHLYEKGLIKIFADSEGEDSVEAIHPKKKSRRRTSRNVFPLMVSVAMFLVSLAWGAQSVAPYVKNLANSGKAYSEGSIRRNRAEDRLRWVLEAYRARKGVYPTSLADLKKAGLVDDGFLETIERSAFRYHLTASGEGYTLL